jgi:transposase InsO family protein
MRLGPTPTLSCASRSLRWRIGTAATGVGMIHLKLRQKGLVVNYKRVKRLYQEAGLQVHRRRRKKGPVGERQPLLRPSAANEVWSMDFVFDRTAEGRVVKCLSVVVDATHEAVAIEVERAISGQV